MGELFLLYGHYTYDRRIWRYRACDGYRENIYRILYPLWCRGSCVFRILLFGISSSSSSRTDTVAYEARAREDV